jgi:cell division protein ZapA
MITSASENLSSLDAALLCAMDCLDELTKANRNVENIRSQIKDYVDDAGQARLAADEANKELRILRAKVEELQTELKKRTTVIRYDNDKVENARDMLSKEINAAINSPLSRPTVQQMNGDPNRK